MKKLAVYVLLALFFCLSNSQAQNKFNWVKSAGSASTNEDIGRAIFVDANKNVIIGGQFSGVADFDDIMLRAGGSDDFFIAKYDSLGNILWAKSGGSNGAGANGNDFVDDIEVDADGNIFISGYIGQNASYNSFNFPSESGAFLCKLDSDGNLIWGNSFYTGHTSVYDRGKGLIDCDNSGNVYFSTNFIDQIDLHDTLLVMDNFPGQDHTTNIITMMFDSQGNRQWYSTGSGNAANILEDIKIDTHGNILIYGNCKLYINFGQGFLSGQNWLVKYTGNGELLWAINPPRQYNETANGMDIDEQNNVYVLNRIGATGIGVKKLNSNGDLLWNRMVGESDFLTPNGIVCQDNLCYTTGWFEGLLKTDIRNVLAKGVKDIFLVSLSALDGSVHQTIRAGSHAEFPLGYYDAGYGLFKNNEGLYVIGSYKGTADFGDFQMEALGSASDIFFGKLCPEEISNVTEVNDMDINVFPVPTSKTIHVTIPNSLSKIKEITLYSGEGRLVHKSIILEEEYYIDVNKLHNGIYFLKVETKEGIIATREVIVSN